MKIKSRISVYLPILFAFIFALGIYMGQYIHNSDTYNQSIISGNNGQGDKISNVLRYIQDNYVDTVSYSKLVDLSLDAVLQKLDPHSYYIPSEEIEDVNATLEGSFDGIGIEFNIQKDTIFVVSVISGGPSEKVGLMAGDRIVKIDGKKVANVQITSKEVYSSLRGERGTKVKLSIFRHGHKNLIPITITRGIIPNKSVDAAFMTDLNTGYIKLSKFSVTSYDEFYVEAKKLLRKGMKKLIFDLRGNGGGYLNAAIDISNEFLKKGDLILYTEGRKRKRIDYHAKRNGILQNIKVVVLIDEFSASASEIVSGAIQDNDRGTIAGRRSFGKGLVQEQVDLPDNSAIRLTVARYYTPTGRCIQKPYSDNIDDYYNDLIQRYTNGEMETKDSVHFKDSLKYTTPKGKVVYGGGGIMPDVFIPFDTVGVTDYYRELYAKNVLIQFAFEYVDKNRDYIKLKYPKAENYVRTFVFNDKLMNQFTNYAFKQGVPFNKNEFYISKNVISTQLKALIGRNIYSGDVFYQVILDIDNVFKQAQKIEARTL